MKPNNPDYKKSLQLGMSFPTADGRLKKQILFMLVKECGRDSCYRCGEKIERVEDLSIDHKISWLGIDTALFWDLLNIAFSHVGCNRIAGITGRVSSNDKFINAPPGNAWCTGHQQYLPVENFSKSRVRRNGLVAYCKECS